MLRSSPSHPSVASPLGRETPYSGIGGPRGKGMICGDIGNLQAERDDPWQVSDIATLVPLRNFAPRYSVYSNMRIAVSAVLTVAVAGWMFAQQKSVSGSENGCSNAVLHLRCLRQPPVFHKGEVIQAKLSLTSNRQAGLTALPGTRRGFFREIFVWEPEKDAVDPFTLDPRIRVGDQLGSGWSEEKAREIEVNEWVQFRRPGRYVLHAILGS